ncbi:hypothetical protein EDM80_05385 [bacterium]|nr:MAG: hypothetical protein EDM80_05385 [bacterium]RIK64380.1 MAG: hypothetical protein DCC64_04390 [Planctomycetota bacterium]
MPHAPQTAVVRLLQRLTEARNIRPGERVALTAKSAVVPARLLAQALALPSAQQAHPSAWHWFHNQNLPAATPAAAQARAAALATAEAAGLKDGTPAAGHEYLHLFEQGKLLPGEVCMGLSPEVHVAGGLAALGLRLTLGDLAHTGPAATLEFTVPHTLRVNLTGRAPAGLGGFDLFWAIARECGLDSLCGHALEIAGDGLREISLARRLALAEFAAHAGLAAIYVQPDALLVSEINRRLGEAGTLRAYETVTAEAGAEYAQTRTLDLARVQPLVCAAQDPTSLGPVGERAGARVDRVIMAGTACSLESLRLAAGRLKGKTPACTLDVVPATPRDFSLALAEGLISTLVESGARIHPPGLGSALLQDGPQGQTWLTTLAYPPQTAAEVLLCSPAVAAASALAGSLAHPDAPVLLPPRDSKLSSKHRPL